MKVYEEVIDFIAAGTTPNKVIDFTPSELVKERILNLIDEEKNSIISPENKAELDHYMQLEHIMRLAKARARQYILNEQIH